MTILILEDDESCNAMLKMYFEHVAPEMTCYAVPDCRKALAFLNTIKFDAVLLDVFIMNSDCIAVIDYINENNLTCFVCLMTASPTRKDRFYPQLSKFHTIHKPFEMHELQNIIDIIKQKNYLNNH